MFVFFNNGEAPSSGDCVITAEEIKTVLTILQAFINDIACNKSTNSKNKNKHVSQDNCLNL